MYRVVSYYVGKALAELPLNIIAPFIFTIVSYFLIGFNDNSSNVGLALLIMILAYN